ncbi:MAG: methyltransferase domain-containing protein [Deltaproteobacteria bacterium]
MRPRLVDLVVCPKCRGALSASSTVVDGDEIMEGALDCNGCGASYPIRGGIPRLLPDTTAVPDEAQRTVDRFGEQWNDFDFIGPHYEEQFLGWIAPNRPDTFEGRVVLEGGCGKGRHSALVAQWGAKEVLAVDLGSAVEACYRNTRRYENVHVIQADLFHLPVKQRSVDVAFSVGVLHHTPEPERCFGELVSAVRPGGRMIAWVYGRENNGWIVHGVNPVREALTSKMPHRWVYELSKIPAAMIVAMGRGVYTPLSKGPLSPIGKRLFYQEYIRHISKFPYPEVHSIVHDHLNPVIAHYIRENEFRSWFSALSLEDVTIGWHNENSWRGTGIVPQPKDEPRVVEAAS